MTRPDRDDLWNRLQSLESAYGLADDDDGVLVAAPLDEADVDDDQDGRPGDDVEAITTERERDEATTIMELAIPQHRPPVYRNGVTVASYREIRALWEEMPDEVRDRELEVRIEQGLPIPPILQQ